MFPANGFLSQWWRDVFLVAQVVLLCVVFALYFIKWRTPLVRYIGLVQDAMTVIRQYANLLELEMKDTRRTVQEGQVEILTAVKDPGSWEKEGGVPSRARHGPLEGGCASG